MSKKNSAPFVEKNGIRVWNPPDFSDGNAGVWPIPPEIHAAEGYHQVPRKHQKLQPWLLKLGDLAADFFKFKALGRSWKEIPLFRDGGRKITKKNKLKCLPNGYKLYEHLVRTVLNIFFFFLFGSCCLYIHIQWTAISLWHSITPPILPNICDLFIFISSPKISAVAFVFNINRTTPFCRLCFHDMLVPNKIWWW